MPDAERLAAAGQGGADYVEVPVASWVMRAGEAGLAAVASASPPPLAANVLLPSDLPLLGAQADPARVDAYLDTAMGRLQRLGVRTLVFGSGQARSIPAGVSRAQGLDGLERFLREAGRRATEAGVTLVLEPLRSAESNVWTSVAEAAAFLRARDVPGVRLLADLYHMREEGEPVDAVAGAAGLLAHVHVAGPGRRPPCADAELRAFFEALGEAGYAGDCSIECRWEDFPAEVGPAIGAVRAAMPR